jgi:hypothetical protein
MRRTGPSSRVVLSSWVCSYHAPGVIIPTGLNGLAFNEQFDTIGVDLVGQLPLFLDEFLGIFLHAYRVCQHMDSWPANYLSASSMVGTKTIYWWHQPAARIQTRSQNSPDGSFAYGTHMVDGAPYIFGFAYRTTPCANTWGCASGDRWWYIASNAAVAMTIEDIITVHTATTVNITDQVHVQSIKQKWVR